MRAILRQVGKVWSSFIGVKPGGNLLRVDYSQVPSFIGFALKAHPDRKDVVKIDPSRAKRVSMLYPGESSITGFEFLRRLKENGKKVYDIRVMEEFLKHPELIPEEWKVGWTYFFGTVFSDDGGPLSVAWMYWEGGRWHWNVARLKDSCATDELAAAA